MMVKVARLLVGKDPSVAVILSTHLPVDTEVPQIIHGGELTMRETARLTHHVDLFVGCGSGLTVVATSEAAKRGVPNIQVLSQLTSKFASFKHDFEHFGLDASAFLEITRPSVTRLAAAMRCVLDEGIERAKRRYSDALPLDFTLYFQLIDQMLLKERRFVDAARSVTVTIGRYGARRDLVGFANSVVLPFLRYDEALETEAGQAAEAALRQALAR
jgi:hypothetical protein